MDRPLRYHCLSYVWGDASDRVPISLNGQAFSITRNLWIALRRLRWYGQLDYLWVDAICINQDDMYEKSQQVRKMADIYSQTQEVIIWLGEDDVLGEVTGYEEPSSSSLKNVFGNLRLLNIARRPSAVARTKEVTRNGVGFLLPLIGALADERPITNTGYLHACKSCPGRSEHIHSSLEWRIACH